MRRISFLIVLVVLLSTGCGGSKPTLDASAGQPAQPLSDPTVAQVSATAPRSTDTSMPPTPTPTAGQPTETLSAPTMVQVTATALEPTDTPTPLTVTPLPTLASTPAEFTGLPLPTDRGEFFSGSGVCTVCHTQMTDQAGNDVSTDTFWRTSMMANAARDPYWRASVQAEVLSNPLLQTAIEDKCTTCHMPMARFTVAAAGGDGAVQGNGFSNPSHDLHILAMDGVSCTLCHQILEAEFGEPSSFSGGFSVDVERPAGERESYGPHSVRPGLSRLMQTSSGFVPVQSGHMDQSELCATCHTLYTPYVDAAGEIVGEFPEQMPYLEWLASSFAKAVSCQGCHMPQAEGGVQLSNTGGPLRSPYHQHIFVGGNVYMLEILETFGEELAVTSSSSKFGEKKQQVLDQLQNRTATIDIKMASVDGTDLVVDVSVGSMVGHKFPAGFPSRRVWIHLVIQNASGQVIFESGGVAPDGSIVGNDNDAHPTAYEPHYVAIHDAEQIQIYEAIMGNTEGEVTTTLLRGAEYLKDNRLPPSGFEKGTVAAEIAVRGAALEDADFVGGGDRIQYIVDVGRIQGPFTVTAELLYQSIGYRWAENLRAYKGQELDRFTAFYDRIANQPVIVARASMTVED